MKQIPAITAALLLGAGSLHADFTSGMLARWTFNDTSSEQAAFTDDVGQLQFKKGVWGKDTGFFAQPGRLRNPRRRHLPRRRRGQLPVGKICETGRRRHHLLPDQISGLPELSFPFGLMNSVQPADWAQLIFDGISTPKGMAVRAKGPEKLEAGMASGHLPTSKDGYSDVAIVFNGKTRKLYLYVDGKWAERHAPMTRLDSFQSLMLGRLKQSNSQKMQIDEVRIYATPLSAEWIAEIEPVEKK